MNGSVLDKVKAIINEDIVNHSAQAGGCIANSLRIKTASGNIYFLKQGFSSNMFICEANGLREISRSATIKTPKVIAVNQDFILLENIEHGLKTQEAMFSFGCTYAQMHQYTGKHVGFYENNFIGSTPQLNTVEDNWLDFFHKNRLLYQYKLAEANGYADTELRNKFIKIEKQLPQILSGSEEEPSLLHGDLWSGNYLIDHTARPFSLTCRLLWTQRGRLGNDPTIWRFLTRFLPRL